MTISNSVVRLPGSEHGWRRLVSDKMEAKLVMVPDLIRAAPQVGRGGKLGVTWIDGPHPKLSDNPLDRPIIFVHGAGGNPRNFDKMIAKLRAEGHRNIAVIKYSMVRQPLGLDDPQVKGIMASFDQASAQFRAAGYQNATIVGHSYGSALAIAAASRQPSVFTDIIAVGGFLKNFNDPGPGASMVSKGLLAVGRFLHLNKLEKNIETGFDPRVQQWLADPKSIRNTRLATISAQYDDFVNLDTSMRPDAAQAFIIPDENHLGLPASAETIATVSQLLLRPPRQP
jgi:pimeloyl-ACP methyl ester carboxylesterase